MFFLGSVDSLHSCRRASRRRLYRAPSKSLMVSRSNDNGLSQGSTGTSICRVRSARNYRRRASSSNSKYSAILGGSTEWRHLQPQKMAFEGSCLESIILGTIARSSRGYRCWVWGEWLSSSLVTLNAAFSAELVTAWYKPSRNSSAVISWIDIIRSLRWT